MALDTTQNKRPDADDSKLDSYGVWVKNPPTGAKASSLQNSSVKAKSPATKTKNSHEDNSSEIASDVFLDDVSSDSSFDDVFESIESETTGVPASSENIESPEKDENLPEEFSNTESCDNVKFTVSDSELEIIAKEVPEPPAVQQDEDFESAFDPPADALDKSEKTPREEGGFDSSTKEILKQIAAELAALKNEIFLLKADFDELKNQEIIRPVQNLNFSETIDSSARQEDFSSGEETADMADDIAAAPEDPSDSEESHDGFFSGGADDEIISLSGDELKNILTNSEFPAGEENGGIAEGINVALDEADGKLPEISEEMDSNIFIEEDSEQNQREKNTTAGFENETENVDFESETLDLENDIANIEFVSETENAENHIETLDLENDIADIDFVNETENTENHIENLDIESETLDLENDIADIDFVNETENAENHIENLDIENETLDLENDIANIEFVSETENAENHIENLDIENETLDLENDIANIEFVSETENVENQIENISKMEIADISLESEDLHEPEFVDIEFDDFDELEETTLPEEIDIPMAEKDDILVEEDFEINNIAEAPEIFEAPLDADLIANEEIELAKESAETDEIETEIEPAGQEPPEKTVCAAESAEEELDDTPTDRVFGKQWGNAAAPEADEMEVPAAFIAPQKSASNAAAPAPKSENFGGGLKEQVKTVLTYMDKLLENLPEEKIEEFAHSKYFDTYKKLFEELGIA